VNDLYHSIIERPRADLGSRHEPTRRGRPPRPHTPPVSSRMSPEVWEQVARELNTVRQLSRNWLTVEQAEKIARHLARVR
jgi:hypothetical protein